MSVIQFYERYRGKLPRTVYKALIPDTDLSLRTDADILLLAEPDAIDWELRLRIDRIVKKIDKDPDSEVIWTETDFAKGITTIPSMRMRLDNPYKRHFLSRPLHKFEEATDNLITTITSRFYEIANIPLTYGKGVDKKVDHRNAKLMMDLARLLLDRKHGKAEQLLRFTKDQKPETVRTQAEVEAEILELEAEFDDGKKGEVPKDSSGKEETTGVIAIPSESKS